VNELQAATESLGIPKNRVKVIDDVGCKDGMSNKWSTSAIYYHVTEYIDLIHPNLVLTHPMLYYRILTMNTSQVITFDEFGVSGHPNHIDVYKAVKQIRTMHRPQDRETVFLQLNTTNTCRKFLGFFDIILSLMCSEHVVINLNMWSVLTALRLHSTQSVWYRILFVIFSRFTYINSLRKID
jgi:N-acetylglucosaminylphosphatidylinositol deacetylase